MPALDGMRILDMTQYEAGPSCTQVLAWLGADVVKVEPPGRGEPGRGVGGSEGDSAYFVNWNSNKRSIALDLQQESGRELLLEMAPHYDVFVENYGPGVVERLQIDYEALSAVNPRIIYARVKGFGSSGPYAGYKCYDTIAQAGAGALSVTGDADGPPLRPGPSVGDSGTGMQVAVSLLAAYVEQQRTGKGQLIEVSMQEAMTYYMRSAIGVGADWGNAVAPRAANGATASANLYPCKPFGANDYVYVICATSRMWDSLCAAIERPELASDPRFATDAGRVEHAEELLAAISDWTNRYDKWEAMRILGEAGVPCSAVFDTVDLFNNEHLNSRGFVQTLEHPHHGEVRVLGWAPRMGESRVPIQRAPLLGEHSDEILAADMALDDERISELREAGVVG